MSALRAEDPNHALLRVEPSRHFKFDDDGITNEIQTARRPSSHFVPIPRAKKKGKQLQFETEWTRDRIEPNPIVDRIRQRDVLPPDLLERIGQARILITNYHAFLAHERGDAARVTKAILTKGAPNPFTETPGQIVRRVCRDLAAKKHIVVINDEAHHCYRRRPEAEAEALGPRSS